MRRPSFQFYPADWLSNTKLLRCSHEEKGVWIDILCIMNDAAQYGVLQWPLSEIARSVGTSMEVINGLVRKGILKGSDTYCEAFTYTPFHARKAGKTVILIAEQDGPLWYSSRMVEDEYRRSILAINGSKKSSPNPSKGEGKGVPKGDSKGVHLTTHPTIHLSEDEEEEPIRGKKVSKRVGRVVGKERLLEQWEEVEA